MRKTVKFPQNLARQFKRRAKKTFPVENYAILLGRREKTLFVVEKLYFPGNVVDFSDCFEVQIQEEWWEKAQEEAFLAGLSVLGDLHSHCYPENESYEWDAVASEHDFDASDQLLDLTEGGEAIMGICAINSSGGKLRSRFRFWPVVRRLETKIV